MEVRFCRRTERFLGTLHASPRFMKARRRSRSRRSVVDIDPGDPAQQLDEASEFHVDPLDVEARPSAEATADIDLAIELAEEEEGTSEEDEALGLEEERAPTADEIAARTSKDVGDLYGVHMPRASDPELASDDLESFQDATFGESFTEELLAKATEGGPTPEHEVDVVDDSDANHPTHHATESGDRPVADKGSGGPGGL
jgi:hypothetical protein